MNIKLRYPDFDIPGLQQVRSYLYQIVDELNIALASVETQTQETKAMVTSATSGKTTEETAQSSFNSIKSLIIKSADVVNAYYDVINKRLEGSYVAQSAFGTYSEETAQTIEANSTGIEQLFENIQKITGDINSLIKVDAHINTGILYYDDAGVPVYGLEIGQKTEIDGVEVFNKYARFTSDKLSFFDSNGIEVAYISDKKLYITHIEVTGSYKIGALVDTSLSDGSVVTRYIASGGEK